MPDATGNDTSNPKAPQNSFSIAPPAISLPKGGGAIRGIGEKFAANPVTGTGSMSVPIATSPGRSGFGPQLSLSYDSGAGNGPFGFGWSLSLPSITRKTDKGLPQYLDGHGLAADSDVFILSGAEDLVPVYRQDPDGSWTAAHLGYQRDSTGFWVRDPAGHLVIHEDERDGYRVRRYRPRIEGLFARIERWSRVGVPGNVHWRSISKDNILTLYGFDENARIADPLDSSHIFSWLICETRDDKGNGVRYIYKKEDGTFQLRPGQSEPFAQAHQLNRGLASDPRRTAQRYLQRVLYGNIKPLLNDEGERPRFLRDLPNPPTDTSADWLFEVRFDYGELDEGDPTGQPEKPWFYRPDAFSSYRSGFEVRTCRRCERVLMLHHIPDQPAGPDRVAQPGYQGVVRSTDFTYDDELAPGLATKPIYSFLKQVVQMGWKQENGSTTRRSLPPVEFEYTKPIVQDAVEEVDPASLENLPIGVDGTAYQWTDLHGEGIPGILTEQAGAWYYKRNWSPIPDKLPDGNEVVKAKFSALETVALKPNLALAGGAQFMDLAGDGQPDLVMLDGPMPGLYEHDEAEGWESFRPFTSRLNRDMRDPNLKFVDLDGDGHADVLITEHDAFVWHPSLVEEGFGEALRVAQVLDEEKGPRLVFADGTQSIYLADLSGDGLTDLVRIRNGEVCYWPNLGYGRFGAKVTMDHAPWFDNQDQFDHKRIRLADIDGSGTTDIIYLSADGVRLFFNQSGNSWSQPQPLNIFPRIDDLAAIVPTDLLGNGTACLVWSSPLPGDARRQMRYVDLMGGIKPHLLVKTVNNLGAETRVQYAPSIKFYLQDKREGKPWVTKLPFPVHVVEKVETFDHISRNRFVTRYTYHHGYFDDEEREFRGFGRVDQLDTEELRALANNSDTFPVGDNIVADSHVPPVLTKTWFHTGVYVGHDHISNFFAGLLDGHDRGEYYREPAWRDDDVEARKRLLADTVVPSGLTLEEEREACRALKGSMLRQEVYALDDTAKAEHPYTVAEQNFTVERVQPRAGNRHGVFFTHPREAITYHYERNPADPRVQHGLTLQVDLFGNVLKSVAIGYGRRMDAPDVALLPEDREKERIIHITWTENELTNAIVNEADVYRTPLPAQSRTYELRKAQQEKSGNELTKLYRFEEILGHVTQSGDGTHDIEYEDLEFARAIQAVTNDASKSTKYFRRLIEQVRTLYRPNDLGTDQNDPLRLLPLRDMESMALPGESYKLAFTPGLLDQVYVHGGQNLFPANPADVLAGGGADRGGYVDLDNNGRWWIPSGRMFHSPDSTHTAEQELAYARRHFFLPHRYRDPFHTNAVSTEIVVTYDAYDLLMVESRDPVGNRVTVGERLRNGNLDSAKPGNDYRVLQPKLVMDPNRNRTQVAFDALGMVVGTAVMGKPLPVPVEGDLLTGFIADLTQVEIDNFHSAADPHTVAPALLQNATMRIVYDLDRFHRTQEANPAEKTTWLPPYAATLARETHVSDLAVGQQTKIQVSLSYSDGFGREIQKKIQAEPEKINGIVGPPRWVGSGWTIFNNKGKPVRQYEPFFSQLPPTERHHFEFGVMVGVSPVLFYDPVERVIATLHPNHTFEKVVFDPWQQTTYDVNDTCAPRNTQTGDPRTDPDIRGYVTPYFAGLPANPPAPAWQTWHQQRIGGALGLHEQAAATLAAAHADTPTTAHFDALGRPFLTLARNRVVCANHQLDGNENEFATRVEFDIEGNQRAVRDAVEQAGDKQGRIVMRYAYDLLGNRIHQASMEAGARWMLNDVSGKSIRAWDSRGHIFRTEYDPLRRPLRTNVTGADPANPNQERLTDRLVYGEQHPEADPRNLRGKLHLHLDQAGVVVNEADDFKGNSLRASRRLTNGRQYKQTVDWRAVDANHVALPTDARGLLDPVALEAALAPRLEADRYTSSTTYDALNRPLTVTTPDGSIYRPTFNEAYLLDKVDVNLRGAAVATPFVTNIDYDAKGQRTLIAYGNQSKTEYRYDPETFRLINLKTIRGSDNAVLQDLQYTYDPVGNIIHIQDDAQQTIYFRNQVVEPHNDYTYDAIYQLIQATGREHLGQGGAPIPDSYNDAGRVGVLSADRAGRFAPNDGNAMDRYCEKYVYDAVGNFTEMSHHRSCPAAPSWRRTYTYAEASLIDPGKQSNRLSSTTVGNNNLLQEQYGHDVHGNMLRMPQLQVMQWDYKDQLQMTQRQKVNDEDVDGVKRQGERTYYVYDASGQRVRKVTELANGNLKDERLYLGGFEIYRNHSNHAGLVRETLHIMDDKQLISLMETRNAVNDGSPQQLIRYQFGNHLGSASLELDEQAQIISYEEYAPYGSSTYQAVRSKTETAKRYRYTGKERDEESGLYYHGARYYAVWIAVWTAIDPIASAPSRSQFAAFGNNPLRFTDPTGNEDDDSVPAPKPVRIEKIQYFSAEEMQQRVEQYKDKDPPPRSPADKLKPVHNVTPEHQAKVRDLVNWAIQSAAAEAKADRSASDILSEAQKKIAQLRESSEIPDASNNLIYRDADHYLASRTQEYPVRAAAELNKAGLMSSEEARKLAFTPGRSRAKNEMSAGPLGVNQVYETRKLQEFKMQAQSSQSQGSVAVGKNPPSAAGGTEWGLLGMIDYERYDEGVEKRNGAPHLLRDLPGTGEGYSTNLELPEYLRDEAKRISKKINETARLTK